MRLLLLYKQIFSSEIKLFDLKKKNFYKESEKEQRPSSLGVQGDNLALGLRKIGVEVATGDLRDKEAKENLYRAFSPDFVVGVGYWGDVPDFVDHPQKFGKTAVPWIVADGAVLNYQENLNRLKLVLTTSKFAQGVLTRDGVSSSLVKVVYEGVDTETFKSLPSSDSVAKGLRTRFAVSENELMLYTLGGDAASKGVPEVLATLSIFDQKFKDWKYIVKVSLNESSRRRLKKDLAAIKNLGFEKKVFLFSELLTEEEMVALFNACDIYIAPSRNESFGRPLVEAASCSKPVLTVDGTATSEVVNHGVTGFAAKVEKGIYKKEFKVGEKEGLEEKVIVYDKPKLVEVRADPVDLAHYLHELTDGKLRKKMGEAARKFVLEKFDYRVSAQSLVKAIKEAYSLKD